MPYAIKTRSITPAANCLPDWMLTNAQLGPKEVVVGRKHNLPGQRAMSDLFDMQSAARREVAAINPATNCLPANPEQSCQTLLPTNFEKRIIEGSSMFKHVDIVSNNAAKSQQKDDFGENKLGVEIWQRVKEELYRRRLPMTWLQSKLNCSRQVTNSWGRRGVPGYRYEQLAAAMNWSIDKLVTGGKAEAVAVPAAASGLSPKAENIARTFDALNAEHARERAYSLMMQILLMSDAPMPPAPHVPEPVEQPTRTPHYAR